MRCCRSTRRNAGAPAVFVSSNCGELLSAKIALAHSKRGYRTSKTQAPQPSSEAGAPSLPNSGELLAANFNRDHSPELLEAAFRRSHEHPVVLPHVSHFMHVPFRTSVKLPHSPQGSPS